MLATERDKPHVQQRRVEYLERVRHISASSLVFLDETGVNVTMTRRCSRSPVGTRAYGKAPRNHRVNLTVVGAIALDGMRAMMAYEGGTTKFAFLHYVRSALVPSLKEGDVVVMDNLKAHYAKGVEEAINEAGASVLFLPPYACELNPIEMTWSKMKAILRKLEARSLKALAGALPRIIKKFRPSDITGWFRHAGYGNQPKCGALQCFVLKVLIDGIV